MALSCVQVRDVLVSATASLCTSQTTPTQLLRLDVFEKHVCSCINLVFLVFYYSESETCFDFYVTSNSSVFCHSVCMRVRVRVRVRTWLCVCVYVCACTYVVVCVCMCVYTHTRTHAQHVPGAVKKVFPVANVVHRAPVRVHSRARLEKIRVAAGHSERPHGENTCFPGTVHDGCEPQRRHSDVFDRLDSKPRCRREI